MTRKIIIGIVAIVAVFCVAFFFGLRWVEASVTFHPIRYSAAHSSVPHGAQDVSFETADGVRLRGWVFAGRGVSHRETVIYFHGNTGNIKDTAWLGQKFSARGFDVLVFDYRGYGASDGKLSDETELYRDADAAYDYVTVELGRSADQIVLYGQSLGTAAVADLASRRKCGAIILESGLSSASEVASNFAPWLPNWLHFLGRNRFESAKKMSRIHCPVLVTHGDPDPVIPLEQGRKLFTSANEPKKLLIFPGAGHVVFGSQGDKYVSAVSVFIRTSIQKSSTPQPVSQAPRPDTPTHLSR